MAKWIKCPSCGKDTPPNKPCCCECGKPIKNDGDKKPDDQKKEQPKGSSYTLQRIDGSLTNVQVTRTPGIVVLKDGVPVSDEPVHVDSQGSTRTVSSDKTGKVCVTVRPFVGESMTISFSLARDPRIKIRIKLKGKQGYAALPNNVKTQGFWKKVLFWAKAKEERH